MPLDATISSAPISDCQPESRADAQAGDDRRHRRRQQDFADDRQFARAERLRRLDVAALDVARAAIRVDHARRERAAEDDEHRTADARAEPQRGERHPRDRRDEAQRVEERRHDVVEPAEPAHREAERHADRATASAKPIAEATERRQQVLLQRVADEGLAASGRRTCRSTASGRRQELRLHEPARPRRASTGRRSPRRTRGGQAPRTRDGKARRPCCRATRGATASRGARAIRAPRSSAPPATATTIIPTRIIAGKRSRPAW